MPSANVLINSTPLPTTGQTGADVSASSTVDIALESVGGVVSWSLSCSNYDGYNSNGLPATINSGLTINQNNYTASFTAPAMMGSAGSALQFTSIVNQGLSTQNTVTFGIFVLNSNGSRFFFGNESFESNATVGCAFDLNTMMLTLADGQIVASLILTNQTTATSATAGSNGDVPSQVAKYLDVSVNGTTYKIPLYNV